MKGAQSRKRRLSPETSFLPLFIYSFRKKPLPVGSGFLRNFVKKLVLTKFPEVKEAPKTNKSNPSAYMGYGRVRFVQ